MVKCKLVYYPGCTATKAAQDDTPVRAVLKLLDVDFAEPPDWTCCGALFPLREDTTALLEPARNLVCISKVGQEVVTSCPFCYNTLKRTNRRVKEDSELGEKLATCMEEPYDGGVKVLHLLEFIRDRVGFKELEGRLKVRLNGLKVAPLYGCMLLRPPDEIELDDPERPRILDDLLVSLGSEVIDYGYKTKCCGSYLSANLPDVVDDCVKRILDSAKERGAEAVATTCALCHFNLDTRGAQLPVFCASQLLAIGLGTGHEVCRFDLHRVDPLPLLKDKGII